VTFASIGVPARLCATIESIGWKRPTPIQSESLPYSLKGRDIIGLAQTGSGKTGAYGIPILAALLENPRHLFACILAPTRELAYQIGEQLDALGSGFGVVSAVLVGGMDIAAQTIALAKKPHLVIGTPGRVLYHLQNTKGFTLKTLKFFVLDEADRLLNLDFEEEINTILRVIPKERNTYLFSATMTQQVAKLQRASLSNPVKVEVDAKYTTVEKLLQNYLFLPEKHKDCYLAYLLNEVSGNSVIIFTIQCITCQRVALMLRNLGFGAIPLNGKMTQTKRLGSLNKFKSKDRNILVATDVASRGLDIPDVDMVINYDIPSSPKDYIHRVGRTARAGKSGRALSLVSQYDVEMYQKIESYLGKQLEVYHTEEETVLILMERVAEAQRYAAVQLRESGFGKRRKGGPDVGEEPKEVKRPRKSYKGKKKK